METCCVCGCKVFDPEEAELERDTMYCDACSVFVTCGVYPNHILWEASQAEYQNGPLLVQEKRYRKINYQNRRRKTWKRQGQ